VAALASDLPKRPVGFEIIAVTFLIAVAAWNLSHPLERSERRRPPKPNAVGQAVVERIHAAFDPPVSPWVSGLLLGDDSGFSRRWKEIFRRTGTSHLTAVSGTNLGYVYIAALSAARLMPLGRGGRAAFGLACIAFFAALTGGSGSVIRAAAMFGLLALAREALGRPVRPLRALLLAVTVLTAIHPRILTDDRSFQLSALAMFGISALAPPLEATVFRRWPDDARRWAAETVSATLATAPMIAWMSGGFSPVTLIANIAVAAFIAPMMAAGAAAALIGFILPEAASLLGGLLAPFFSLPLLLLRFLSELPLAYLTGARAIAAVLAVEAAVLAAIFIWWRRQGAARMLHAQA